jgi:hypothetical protein
VPIGWTDEDLKDLHTRGWPFLIMIGGWVIAAIATLFGAPFWFDTLQQIIRLKGAGPSPAEKQEKTGAAA